jgi:hypothetical protein
MLMFRVLGSWVRGLYMMGFGAFWLMIAYLLRGGPGNSATTMGAIGGLMLLSGGIVIMRGLAMTTTARAPLPQGSTGWRDDGKPAASDTGFDADAAISRYLQNRPQGAAEPAAAAQVEPETIPPAPPLRPTFGRKQI